MPQCLSHSLSLELLGTEDCPNLSHVSFSLSHITHYWGASLPQPHSLLSYFYLSRLGSFYVTLCWASLPQRLSHSLRLGRVMPHPLSLSLSLSLSLLGSFSHSNFLQLLYH
ncbi:hypothetical protein AMTRI_Chr02g220170 [Amborella trichopoda]